MLEKECIMKKAEPWNSVRITFILPKEYANKLKELAQRNDEQLKRLGIVSVQVEGGDTVKLSISDNEGNIQQVIVRQQSAPLPVSSALTHSSSDLAHADGHHEFDTILSQLKASGLQPGSSNYVTPSDHNVFVVPQQTTRKRNTGRRKSKEKGQSKVNTPGTAGILTVTPNGPLHPHNTNTQDLLPVRMDVSNQPASSETLAELGAHLDFNDLIGADGSLDNLEKHYPMEEMVTDILHMDGIGPQHNPTLGMSPSSLNSNQVQPQMDGGGLNNASHPNATDHTNTNEVDELLNHLNSFEAEEAQSTSQLNPSIGDMTFSQENSFANVSGHSPAIQRQMSFPQYSSKHGPMHGPNSQAMFTSASGRQSVGPINTGLASPHHAHMMANSIAGSDPNIHMIGMMQQQGNAKGNMVVHQTDITGKGFTGMEKDMAASFHGYNPAMGGRNPEMMGMPKQGVSNRPPSAGIMQPGGTNNWKMPPGPMPQHPQINTMHHTTGISSPKTMNPISSSGAFNPALTPTKRGYPGQATVPQFDAQPPGAMDGGKAQGMSGANSLLVTLLQTSSSTTMASGMAGQPGNSQLTGAVGEPKPKKKKTPRRKKPSKTTYTQDTVMIPAQGMMTGPGMPSHMPTHMSPQHGGVRMQQSQFGAQYGMQGVNSPGQYNIHHHAPSPLSQMHPGMPDTQKGMYGMYPNGNNMPSPGLHQMGNKASPSHVFSPDQKPAFIETINRSDVGSRLSSGTPTQMGQTRVPTPGHSPSAHGHVTPNHMSSSSAGPGMFIGNVTGTVHHGPRMAGMNGMQHTQMQGRMQTSPRMPQQGMAGMHAVPNMRVSGPSPGMQGNNMMNQQYMMQPQSQFHPTNAQFQSPPPNVATMYNQPGLKPKQGNVMASPTLLANEYLQEQAPPNVVINGSDSLQQAMVSQRQMSGFPKRMTDHGIMMQNDGGVQSPGAFYHQQASNSPMGMKNQNNPMLYNPGAQIPAAAPNNFNNSNNLELRMPIGAANLPTNNPMSAGPLVHCATPVGMSDATVTHYPISKRPKVGVLESGEISVLLKGSCNTSAASFSGSVKSLPANAPSEGASHKVSRVSKKSPNSAMDGHSSSPGSSHSHTPSPASVKRSISTSNPPTPLHLDPIGSPTSMTMQSQSGSRSTTPRQKSGATTPRSRSGTPVGANSTQARRLSGDRQGSFTGHHQRPLNQGPPTPGASNGPGNLSRPLSRTDSNQQYMTSLSTPGQLRHPFQSPPMYQHAPGTMPSMTVDSGFPPHGQSGYGTLTSSYPRDHNFPTQPNATVADSTKTQGSNEGPPKSPWTHMVPNHHLSPNQINSPSTYEESSNSSQHSQNQLPTQQTISNSIASLIASDDNQETDSNSNQNCVINNALPPGVSPQSTETSPRVQNSASPHFFNNNSTQDLLTSGKTKKQQENSSAPTVPLQS